MQPKYKRPVRFMLLVLALTLPYMGFAIYYGSQFKGLAPVWFTNTLAFWFVANFCIAMFLGKRILRGQVVDPNPEVAREATSQSINIASRLLAVWILLFLFGLIATMQGKIPLARALPAGAFLLFFIAFFGWQTYRAKQSQK